MNATAIPDGMNWSRALERVTAEMKRAGAQAAQSGQPHPGGDIETGPVPLKDGTIGYPIRYPRSDDCFAAAIATALQVPIEQVPDPRLDERLAAGESADAIDHTAQAELKRWLARRGLRMIVHRTLPVHLDRWIGVVEIPGDFNNHCLVMARGELLFDPIAFVAFVDGRRVRFFDAEDITLGLSFSPIRRAASN